MPVCVVCGMLVRVPDLAIGVSDGRWTRASLLSADRWGFFPLAVRVYEASGDGVACTACWEVDIRREKR